LRAAWPAAARFFIPEIQLNKTLRDKKVYFNAFLIKFLTVEKDEMKNCIS
jgi:hypothetical protein